MMNNFYWKTFLRFSAITLVLMLTLSTFYFAFIYEKPQPLASRPMFASYASAAISVFEHGGKIALKEWLHNLDKERHIQIYVLDKNNQDVLNRSLPPDVNLAIKKHTLWDNSLAHPMHGHHHKKEKVMISHIHSNQGNNYILASAISPDKPFNPFLINSAQTLGLSIFTMTLIGGIVCVWITWYLTKPVTKLRQATQEWSAGNLSARIGDHFGNRPDILSALARDLDKMAEQLQLMMESQKRLLRDISHELRTPLARLQIALGLARQRNQDSTEPELDRIELEANRLNEMIGQILSLAQLDSLTEIENKQEIDIETLLNNIIHNAEFENSKTQKMIDLKIESHTKKINANYNLLYRALENVIRNALRYTPENTTVTVTVTSLHHQLQIQVRDQGVGVPEETLTKLFVPFFRVADARERNSGGYGLGLAIVKRAIELHNGLVFASNAANGGLVITIQLPIT